MPTRFRTSVMMLLVAAIGLTACGDDSAAPPATGSGAVEVIDATSDKPVASQPNAAVYATVHNGTDKEIVIVGAGSTLTNDVQLHMTITGDDDTTTMQQVESFPVEPGKDFEFQHGGPHIMLMNIDAETFPDVELPMVLMLSDGTEVPFTAGVVQVMEDTQATSPSTTSP